MFDYFSQWNGPFTDFTSLALVLRASGDWKSTRAYEHMKLSADFEWLMKWLKLVNDSWPTLLLRWYSGLKHHYESPHRLLPPTNQDGVENPRPVRWRLYVSVLVHSLDGRSHVEGIHLKLGEEKKTYTKSKGETCSYLLIWGWRKTSASHRSDRSDSVLESQDPQKPKLKWNIMSASVSRAKKKRHPVSSPFSTLSRITEFSPLQISQKKVKIKIIFSFCLCPPAVLASC